MRTTRYLQLLTAGGLLGGMTLAAIALLAPTAASAIPAPQRACSSPFLTLTGGTGPYHSMGVSVHVNDGSSSRIVVVFVSMDANVVPNAEMRFSWKVDSHPAVDYQYGPGNIAENQQYVGTRTVMDVIPLGRGNHTLTPEVRLSGGPSTSGVVYRLCVVAEVHTS
ncbi:MAG: hypothetical protein ACLQFR_20210 [Streptosporangiaceae bacterium]